MHGASCHGRLFSGYSDGGNCAGDAGAVFVTQCVTCSPVLCSMLQQAQEVQVLKLRYWLCIAGLMATPVLPFVVLSPCCSHT
jgi:hypothetical protein